MKIRFNFITFILTIFIILIALFYNLDQIRSTLRDSLSAEFKVFIKDKFFGQKYIEELAFYRQSNYNQKILPETQFEKINLIEHKINLFNESPRFFIEKVDKKIIAINSEGKIAFLDVNNFNVQTEIKNNLIRKKNIEVLDFKILNGQIYLAAKNIIKSKDCSHLSIFSSDLKKTDLFFKKIFESKECTKSNESAKIEISNFKNITGLLIATSATTAHGLASDEKFLAQKDSSIFGKIIFLNLKDTTTTVVAKGIRFPKSLYDYNGLIFFTEGYNSNGDEINILKTNENYGWPVASYGEEDNLNAILQNQKEYIYKKNHSSFGYKEPLISFYPSIQINSLIKIPENFSNYWENNFLLTSNSNLYRIRFDKSFNKVLLFEKIVLGKPTGDILYLSKLKSFVVASNGKILTLSKYE